jgi:hypothetical protein
MDRVHGQWTTARSRITPWTSGGTDGRTLGCGGVLSRVWPPATLEHGISPTRAQKREGSVGNPSRASPELRRWCGGWAMAMKRWQREDSAIAVFELGRKGESRRGECGENQRGGALIKCQFDAPTYRVNA